MPSNWVESVKIRSIDPTDPRVYELVELEILIYFKNPGRSVDCVEYVAAIDSKSNIVKRERTRLMHDGVGGFGTRGFLVSFNSPGTHTLWVGARYLEYCSTGQTEYTWSEPVTMHVREGQIPSVARVVITDVSPTRYPLVGAIITVRAVVYLTAPAFGKYDCVACTLAWNRVIYVGLSTVTPQRGATEVECGFRIYAREPGTHTLHVGAKYLYPCEGKYFCENIAP